MGDFSYDPSPDVMGAISQIESGGNPNAVTGSYKGLYQLSQPEFEKYGGQGSIFDPAENTRIAKLKIADEANQLAQKLGRPVTDAEVYLAHQQGVGGAYSHLSNPDQPAWQSMAQTAEGRQKGEEWAKRAIWGNIPDAQKAQFGSVDNVTSGQFSGLWGQRFARAMGQPAPANNAQAASPIRPDPGAQADLRAALQGMGITPLPGGNTPNTPNTPMQPGIYAGMPPIFPGASNQPVQVPLQMGPIQTPQFAQARRPVDLSRLQAALQNYSPIVQG